SARAGRDQLVGALLGVVRFEPLRLLVRGGLEVVAAAALLLAPLGDVCVHLAPARLERSAVDRDLEAGMEHDLARAALVLGDDLGRDVAPPDHGEGAGHQAAAVRIAVARSPRPVWRCSKARSRRSAAERARSTSSTSSVWPR